MLLTQFIFTCTGIVYGLQTQKARRVIDNDEELSALIDREVQTQLLELQYSISAQNRTRTSVGNSKEAVCSRDQKRIWLYASHHKSGTELFRNLARYQSMLLGQPPCVNHGCARNGGPCTYKFPSSQADPAHIYFSCHLFVKQLEAIQKFSGGDWRAVHVIRDPIALVVSGYIYHMRSGNRDLDGQTAAIRDMPTSEGLRLEAEFALTKAIPQMVDAVKWERDHPENTLVVRLEEFTRSSQDYDASVRRLYDFLAEDVFCPQYMTQLSRMAVKDDLNRAHAAPAGGSKHVAGEDIKEEVKAALQSIPAELHVKLQDARKKLGYA